MKQYKFEVIITAGKDEYWDKAKGEEVLDEVKWAILDVFSSDGSNVEVKQVGFLLKDE